MLVPPSLEETKEYIVAAVPAVEWTVGLMCVMGCEELLLCIHKIMGITKMVPLQIIYLHVTQLLSRKLLKVFGVSL